MTSFLLHIKEAVGSTDSGKWETKVSAAISAADFKSESFQNAVGESHPQPSKLRDRQTTPPFWFVKSSEVIL